jgi:UDP-glucose 4-epimerase
MSKILVTGGCGYIGSHTIIEIIKSGYDVISIDNNINSSLKTIDRIEKVTGKRVTNYNIDLCNQNDILDVFKSNLDICGVIHFAALKSVPESVKEPIRYYQNNIQSLLNLIQACEIFKVNNFIFSSSCSVYGDVKSLPVNENTPLSIPVSPYAHTKLIGEEMINHISKTSGINFIILRYFNPVGADLSGLIGEDPINLPTSLVPIITQTAKGIRNEMFVYGDDYDTRDGTCIRDYIHVSDIADAHIKSFEFNKTNTGVEIFNLGSGNGVSVLEAIKSFEEVSGVKVNYKIVDRRIGDVVEIYSDSSKAKNILGWEPKRSLNEMMLSAWKWQLNSDFY